MAESNLQCICGQSEQLQGGRALGGLRAASYWDGSGLVLGTGRGEATCLARQRALKYSRGVSPESARHLFGYGGCFGESRSDGCSAKRAHIFLFPSFLVPLIGCLGLVFPGLQTTPHGRAAAVARAGSQETAQHLGEGGKVGSAFPKKNALSF